MTDTNLESTLKIKTSITKSPQKVDRKIGKTVYISFSFASAVHFECERETQIRTKKQPEDVELSLGVHEPRLRDGHSHTIFHNLGNIPDDRLLQDLQRR